MGLSIRNLFRSSGYLFLGASGRTGLMFLHGLIVAKAFGPSLYGVWGVVLSYCAIVQAILSFRTAEPLTRHLVECKKRRDKEAIRLLIGTALLVDLATRLVAFVVLVVAAPWMAHHLAGSEAALPAYWLCAGTVLASFANASWFSLTRDQRRFGALAVTPGAMPLLRVLGVVVLWGLGMITLTTVAAVFLISAVVEMVVKLGFLARAIRSYDISLGQIPWTRCIRDWRRLGRFWSFMSAGYISNTITSITKEGDLLILALFQSDAEVGMYRLAKKMAALLFLPVRHLTEVVYQDLNDLIVAKQLASLRKSITRLSKMWVPSIIGGAAIALVAGHLLVPVILGPAYQGSLGLFTVLTLNAVIVGALFWARPLILALGEYRFDLYLVCLTQTISLLAMFLLGWQFGAYGVAAGSVLRWASLSFGRFRKARALLNRGLVPAGAGS